MTLTVDLKLWLVISFVDLCFSKYKKNVVIPNLSGVEEDEIMSYLCKASSPEEYLVYSSAHMESDSLILTFTNCVTGKAP